MDFSLVIPAFNEAKKIERDLIAAREFLDRLGLESEILIVDDGSRDGTSAVVARWIRDQGESRFKLVRYEANRGKGFAVRYGMQQARGNWVAFADAGLCVPLDHFKKGIEQIRAGADYAIASRRHRDSQIRRSQPLYRRLGSKVFWAVVKFLMGVEVTDTQCGFKIYSRKAASAIFPRLKTDGFMFDIEALMLAPKLGLKVAEFPVEWSNDSDTRYHPFWGTLKNFRELVRIRFRILGTHA